MSRRSSKNQMYTSDLLSSALRHMMDELPIFLCFCFCFCFVFADSLQAQLINMDVIPTLVKLLGIHSHNTALTEMCLIAFGNLAELGEYKHH